jgi:hypothetical protein
MNFGISCQSKKWNPIIVNFGFGFDVSSEDETFMIMITIRRPMYISPQQI